MSHCNEERGNEIFVPKGKIYELLGDKFIDLNQYKQFWSTVLGVFPPTGTYKDFQEAITGYDIITSKMKEHLL
ncbi:pre-toxin TG domain-containing protein [Sedimentibacter saalensis]|uniref:Putative toxin of predicted polymorphic toxin system n=1 Tax=Sedimentibacter saalensis TaxID=130788 RepID=A0A562IZD7_9FIRM|nr:pre-toxin TG domain-containing protein [Sedimentibacter saalensis]TWH76379.1 putative toxin of predicted polymorphic toxin system [Sedimentibacter saalensis]